MRITAQLTQQLAQLKQQQRLRQLQPLPRGLSNFQHNDYLGLSQHPKVRQAFAHGLQTWGTGSTSSPVVAGFQKPHAVLAKQLAEWLQRDNVLLFNSGFSANQCVMRALGPYYQRILLDRLSHASLLDGVRDLRTWKRFRHNDVAHAKQLLAADGANLLVTESVFSMDGDCAPLTELAELNADLWVDDAHGLGVMGDSGRSAAGLLTQTQAPLVTVTFGKALGVMGAAMVGSQPVIDYLTNRGREFVYSTAFPAAQACAVSAAIAVVQSSEGDQLRQRLHNNIAAFRAGCAQAELPIEVTEQAIQTLIMGSDKDVLFMGRSLFEQGLACGVIRPPTVAENSARLRITLSAKHTEKEISALVTGLRVSYQALLMAKRSA